GDPNFYGQYTVDKYTGRNGEEIYAVTPKYLGISGASDLDFDVVQKKNGEINIYIKPKPQGQGGDASSTSTSTGGTGGGGGPGN
ncbi:MAG: hypothetical protein C4550_04835, partial [Nitrospiraceae bacterium]